ncbi:MAG: SDR family NAD(P)-dependent oxidoreductase [Spirochaeta sp.]
MMRFREKKHPLPRHIRHALPESVWIVTGSSRGIGRTAATLLISHGARVVLHGRDPVRLSQTEKLLADGAEPARLTSVAGDISNHETAYELVNAAIHRFGRLDGIIANAGISMRGSFLELSPEVMESVVGVNLLGTAYTLQAALPCLQKFQGRAVVVSSLAGLRGFPNVSIYSAARMGLFGLVESIRGELSAQESAVRLSLVALGFTENDPDKQILNAAGQSVTHRRSADATQEQSAAAVIRAAYGRRWFSVTTAKGKLFRLADRWIPGIVGDIIRSSAGRIHATDTA